MDLLTFKPQCHSPKAETLFFTSWVRAKLISWDGRSGMTGSSAIAEVKGMTATRAARVVSVSYPYPGVVGE